MILFLIMVANHMRFDVPRITSRAIYVLGPGGCVVRIVEVYVVVFFCENSQGLCKLGWTLTDIIVCFLRNENEELKENEYLNYGLPICLVFVFSTLFNFPCTLRVTGGVYW